MPQVSLPIDSQSPGRNGKTQRASQSFKNQLWVKWSFKRQSLSVATRKTAIAIVLGFCAHQRVFGPCKRLPGSLLSDNPIDRHLLTADPYPDFQRTNDMRTETQRALIKQSKPRDWHVTGPNQGKTSMLVTRPSCGATTG